MKFVNQTKLIKFTVFSNLKKINNEIPFSSQTTRDTEKRYNRKLFNRKRSKNLGSNIFL